MRRRFFSLSTKNLKGGGYPPPPAGGLRAISVIDADIEYEYDGTMTNTKLLCTGWVFSPGNWQHSYVPT